MSPLNTTKLMMLSLTSFALVNTASAQVSQEEWRELNQSIISGHILPGYKVLAQHAEKLERSTARLCQSPTQQNLVASQQQFTATLAAWQGIQHVTFGPIELLMRSYSIQFWPDKKNLTSKQLNKLLQTQDPKSLSKDAFQTASIAVKGLPAMERILFTGDVVEQIKQSPFRCQFLHSVSEYVSEQSGNTFSEWQTFKAEFDYLESEEGLYETAQEATVDLMKAQIEPLEVIRDLKLIRPLGTKKAKAKRLENWRSQHSLQNIQINIQSLHHMYSGMDGSNLKTLLEEQGATDLAAGIEEQFIGLEKLLAQIPSPLYQHVHDGQVRNDLLMLAEGIEILGKSFAQSMKLLQIQLGFNSRDGD